MQDIKSLVEAVMEEMTPDQQNDLEARDARREAFASTIKNLRKSAIDARKASGIEDQWQEDEDHYESIDNANRTTSSRTKPYDFGGVGTGPTRNPEKGINRSNVFVPMTRPYVDIAAARISDMYMPTDDRNWDGEPTPIPELVNFVKEQAKEAQKPAQPGQPGQQPIKPVDPAIAQMEQQFQQATKAWEKAREYIDDWLKETGYNGELRKAIHDMARIGTGIIKGPHPKSKSAKAIKNIDGGFALEVQSKIIPATVRVDPWNFYPASDCMENVKECSHVFEEGSINRGKLRDLKADGLGYIGEEIDKCLEEGPMHPTTGVKKSTQAKSESDTFSIWWFEGQIEWQDLQDAGCDCNGKEGDVFHATCTMVNDRVIKAALHHLDSGEFTYDVAVWQRKSGLWAGDGVARQGRTAQLGLNAATRILMDNAGQSGRPHKVFNRSTLEPGADPWTWYVKGDADVNDVGRAMMFFNVPSMQVELMNIINFYKTMFEDSTGLPMLLQGHQGSAPDTVGGMEIVQNNAGIVPRNIVRMLDDRFTEPHLKRYYEYLLIHGEDDSAKGEFNIFARGSSALMERNAQDQFLLQMLPNVMNPAFGIDPELYINELLKSKRINPDRLKLSDEKKAEMANRPPPEDPRITTAKIDAQTTMAKAQLEAKESADQLAAEAQLEMARQRYEAQESEKDRELVKMQAEIDAQLATAELSSEERRDLEKQKVLLASVTLRLNVQERMASNSLSHQKDLTVGNHMVDLHKYSNPQVATPAVEPQGKAPDGQAFTA